MSALHTNKSPLMGISKFSWAQMVDFRGCFEVPSTEGGLRARTLLSFRSQFEASFLFYFLFLLLPWAAERRAGLP